MAVIGDGIKRWWRAFAQRIATASTYLPAATKLASSILVVGIVSVLVYQLWQETLIIEPINLPKELEERGYTPTIAANLLRDALQQEEAEARATLKRYRGLSSIRPISSHYYFNEPISDEFYQVQESRQIQVPATGLSIDTIKELLRPLFGSRNRRISGHVVSQDDSSLDLHLQFEGGSIDVENGSKDDLDALLRRAAAPILKQVRPRSMLLADEKNNEIWLKKARAVPPTNKNLEAMCIRLIVVANKSADDARSAMDELLKSLPRAAPTRGWSYACRRDIEMMANNETAGVKLAREAVKIRPYDAAARLALGFILLRQGQVKPAIVEFDQGIKHSNDTAERNVANDDRLARLYYHRGRARAKLGESEHAVEDFGQAIRLDGTHCASYIERARAYLLMDSIDEAIKDSDSADRLCKEQKYAEFARSQAIVRHAQALRAKGEIDAAIRKLQEALELHKGNALAMKELGIALLHKGRHAEAVASLEQSIAAAGNTPPYTTIWLYLAQAESGDAHARQDLQKRSLTLEKNKWPYPVVWMFLGDLEPAGVLARATRKNHKCEAYFDIGQWFLLQGEKDRAIGCFQQVNSEGCPRYYKETVGAKLALKQLQAPEANPAAKCN